MLTTLSYLVSKCFSGKLGLSSFTLSFWDIFYDVFIPLRLVKTAIFLSYYQSSLSEPSAGVLKVYVPILISPVMILSSALTWLREG
jgi:hypothetical protein